MFEIKDIESCRKLWLQNAYDPEINARIERDIEKHRKGYCRIQLVNDQGKPAANTQITISQKKHDFKYGANIFMLDEFDSDELNAEYRELFKKYFNLATLPFYWKDIEPEKGKLRYDKSSPKIYRRPASDRCIEYCEENGVTPKLHCLIYEAFTPEWVPKDDEKVMEDLYNERFRQISERYSGRMWEFEVMNELLCSSSWQNKSVVMDKRDLIKWGFDLARKHFPNEILTINEANSLLDLSKKGFRSPYYLMLENALAHGAKIDRIGVQHHIFAGATALSQEEYEDHILRDESLYGLTDPEKILNGLDVLSTLSLPLEITEITVPTFGDSKEAEELQAELLNVMYSAWFSHPAVDGVVYWNVPDGYAYAPGGRNWNENNCAGGLFHHDLSPKKSADMLYQLFNKKWHTELTLTTDNDGYADFRGFYGEYEAAAGIDRYNFGIHKGSNNCTKIVI